MYLVRTSVLCGALLLSGCATIVSGAEQQVSVASDPSGAAVIIDGNQIGITPYVAELDRKDKHVLQLQLEGYETYQLQLDRKTNGWVWGNIVFGGLIGLVVDASTGAMYKLTPDQITAQLNATESASAGGDQLMLAITLEPSDEWEPIGYLPEAP